MATKKRKRFAEGGISESADKEAGLLASKGEKVGFFDRLRMGNIDDPSSEAYRRFGAGRAKADRDMANEAAAMRAVDASRAAAAPVMSDTSSDDSGEFYEAGSGVVSDTKPDRPKPASKPRVNTQTTKPAESTKSSASTKTSAYPMTKAQPATKTYDRSGGPTAEELANYKPSVSSKYPDIRGSAQDSLAAETRRRVKEGAQAVERVTPETALLPGGGLRAMQNLAKKLAAPKLAKYSQEALPAPTKRLPYDKAGAVTRAREARAAARQEEMLKENAARYGLDPKAPGYEAAAGAIRKDLGGKDFSFKRGGAVKKSATPMKRMASGGMTSKASSRGDGIAQRGKTRGRIY